MKEQSLQGFIINISVYVSAHKFNKIGNQVDFDWPYRKQYLISRLCTTYKTKKTNYTQYSYDFISFFHNSKNHWFPITLSEVRPMFENMRGYLAYSSIWSVLFNIIGFLLSYYHSEVI